MGMYNWLIIDKRHLPQEVIDAGIVDGFQTKSLTELDDVELDLGLIIITYEGYLIYNSKSRKTITTIYYTGSMEFYGLNEEVEPAIGYSMEAYFEKGILQNIKINFRE